MRGGLAKLCGQVASFVLRLTYMVVMARLLDPKDFGLVAMVLVVTGVYSLFSTAGLSTATIQKERITDQQISNLFWINVLVGATLATVCIATAPILVAFYHEQRLFWIAVALSGGFLLTGAGVQHMALLQRQLRYVTVAVIEAVSQLFSYGLAVAMALGGFGYWALVVAAVATPCLLTVSAWVASRWVPARPRKDLELTSLLRFGGTITLNNLVVYIAYNFDKVLLGRFWGADILGIYSRANQLILIPSQTLNEAVGIVSFSALSRLQGDPVRLKSFFLKSYSLVVSLTVPVTISCALFAEDIIRVALGPKWSEAAEVFRLLAPTVLVLSIINPTSWLMMSTGRQVRSLRIAFVIAPLVVASYSIGLPYGPTGVALAYSTAMTLWVVPHIFWCLHGTSISPRDLLMAIWKPLVSGLLAAALAVLLVAPIENIASPVVRLSLEMSAMAAVYLAALVLVFRQKELYLEVLRSIFPQRLQAPH